MEPIKINVQVELNLSQDSKNFIAQLFAGRPVAAAPEAPAKPAAKSAAPEAPAKPAAPAAPAKPATSVAPGITIEQVRKALADKVSSHREAIKEKLNSLGAPSVTKLDPSKYAEMYAFLTAL